MPLSAAHESLIKAAVAAIRAVPRDNVHPVTEHTVGSAALCSDGRVFTGINLFHFTGGPCAEIVTLANATGAGVRSAVSPVVVDGGRLTTIVAVAYDERGVINPCGRCRQTIFDYYPDIEVIVRDGTELKVVGINDLLPHAFRRVKSVK